MQCITAERVKSGHKQYQVRWEDYDSTYDTWEFAEAIEDRALVKEWDRRAHGIRHELSLLRLGIAGTVGALTQEQGDVECILWGIHGAEAHRVLAFLASPPSRCGQAPLEVKTKTTGGQITSRVELTVLDDVAVACLGQVSKPEKAYGSFFFNRGRSHNTDGFFVGPKFTASYAA